MIYNIDKAVSLSHPTSHNKNLEYARNIFLANNYLPNFIKKYLNKRLFKIKTSKNHPSNFDYSDLKTKKILRVPFTDNIINPITF